MAAGRSSFTKRQKEHARLQKRQDKAERKKNRALESTPESDFATNADMQLDHNTDVENLSIESLLSPMKERAQ